MKNLITTNRAKTALTTGYLTEEHYWQIQLHESTRQKYVAGFNSMLRIASLHGYDTLIFHAHGWYEKFLIESIAPQRLPGQYCLICVAMNLGEAFPLSESHGTFDITLNLSNERCPQPNDLFAMLLNKSSLLLSYEASQAESTKTLIEMAAARRMRRMNMPHAMGAL